MSYSFPREGTIAAQLVSPHTREMVENPARVPTLSEARASARNWLKTTQCGATGLYQTCMLANDDIAIVFFGIRGAQRVVWNFGRT